MSDSTDNSLNTLTGAIEKLGVHNHLCLIYETQEEQFAAVIPYIKIGLERGEKCIYIVDDNTADTVINRMKAAGIAVDTAMESGQLTVASKKEAYLRQGYFDADWMIGFLKRMTDEAKAAGFSALRVTGEMTWVLGGEAGTEHLMEYEAKLNYFLPENDALAICQYNHKRFSPDIIKNVISTHPLIIYGGMVCKNLYYIPPDDFLEEQQPDKEITRLLANVKNRAMVEEQINKLNDDLQKRASALEALNKELEEFAYSISHDLRAPLRHIDGFVNLLVSCCRDGLSDKGLYYLDTIASSACQMGVLIDDLLQFSRIGRAEMRKGNMSMNQVLQEVLMQMRESDSDRNIEWVIGELPSVRGDHTMLRHVWLNLLDNAVKYTRSVDIARIEVSARQMNDEIIFAVKDNGVGFDMKYTDKLFGVFQRLHSRQEFEGTGIGLATVHRIINRHGGRVWAEGKLNQGATFYFTLPAQEENHE